MKRPKKRKLKLLKIEKLLYATAGLCMIGIVLLRVFFGANIGNLKLEIEKLNLELTNQNKKNESLVMKVNELTSFDNVKDVVKDLGLAYNKDNIIIVDD
ncbi:MAG: hypothetical protein PHD02_00240 [Bacilli bacterium]|nr:hypothetical protein [Bacilli bacterium]